VGLLHAAGGRGRLPRLKLKPAKVNHRETATACSKGSSKPPRHAARGRRNRKIMQGDRSACDKSGERQDEQWRRGEETNNGGGELLPGRLAAGGLASGLLGTRHLDWNCCGLWNSIGTEGEGLNRRMSGGEGGYL
jgi:hypothetical protein